MTHHPIVTNFAKGVLDLPLPPGTHIAFGNVFEMTRFPPAIGGSELADPPAGSEDVIGKIPSEGMVQRDLWTDALDAWLGARASRKAPLILTPDQHWCLDQRAGAGVAQVQHCADLLPFERFYPASCLRLLRAMTGDIVPDRLAGGVQREMIAELAPALDRIAYNGPVGWTRIQAALGRRGRGVLRRLGS